MFTEIQKFTQWWIWLLLIPIGIMPCVGIYKQVILGEKFGSNSMSDTVLIVFTIVVFLLIGLFLVLRLETKIDHKGIQMKYFPFVKKNILWNDIKTIEVIDYGFVGGWGIRFWTAYGTVYNTKGSIGLAIELINGKKFVIGTQKETELKNIIETQLKEK